METAYSTARMNIRMCNIDNNTDDNDDDNGKDCVSLIFAFSLGRKIKVRND